MTLFIENTFERLSLLLLGQIKNRYRLINSFVLISLLPLLILGYISYIESTREIEEKTRVFSTEVVKQVAKNVQLRMAQIDAESDDIVLSNRVQHALTEATGSNGTARGDMTKMLLELYGSSDYINQKYLLDKTNKIMDSQVFAQLTKGVVRFIEQVPRQQSRPYWGSYDNGVGQQSLGMLHPIISKNSNQQLGSLLLVIRPEHFSTIFDDVNLGNGTDIFILDASNGKVIVWQRGKPFGTADDSADPALVDRIAHSIRGNEQSSFVAFTGQKQVKFLAAFTQIPDTSWFVVSTIPVDKLTAEAQSVRNKTILIGLLCFLFSIVLAYISIALDRKVASEKLSVSEKRFRSMIEAIPDTIILKDDQSRWVIANESAKQLFRLHDSSWQDKTDMELAKLHPELNDVHEKCLAGDIQAWEAGELTLFAETVVSEDGQSHDYEVRKVPIYGAQGQREALLVISHDITARKKAENYERFRSQILELLAGENLLSSILEAIVLGVENLNPSMLCSLLLLDTETKRLINGIAPSLPDFYNAAINGTAIGFGAGSCGAAAVTGKIVIVEDIATHPYWKSLKELAARAVLGSCWSQPILSSSGQILGTFAIYHHTQHTPSEPDLYLIEQSAHLASIAIQRKQAEEEIRKLAFFDVLTKLPNRRLLMDRLHLALSVSARSNHYGALLFLDMDRFKTVNDTLGHDYGDLLLVETANRIQACVREMDTVARFGGDEFVVLLEEVDDQAEVTLQKVSLIAEKIRVALAEPYRLNGNIQNSSPSIGVCLYLGKNVSMETLLKQADMAMYQAKDSGRNTIRFFDPVMQQAAEKRSVLESDLRHAVPDQQLHLHYQVQVDNDLRPMGAEALVRWMHPKHGMVSPKQFIPIAEESSLILDIGDWVLDAACRVLSAWSNNELTCNLTLSVNVSAQQFKQHDFVKKTALTLSIHNIAASRLKLELTESVVLNDVNDVISKMQALKALGVSVSMDDFGTGYSSLSYLKRLPLDQIKIDQSFVRDIATDPNDAMMVQTIIDMAKNFGLNLIAEGVETQAQLAFLQEHGCMAYQGYLFAKPVPIEQFELLLKKNLP